MHPCSDGFVIDEVQLRHGAQPHPLGQGMAQEAGQTAVEEPRLGDALFLPGIDVVPRCREAGEEDLGVRQVLDHAHLLDGQVGESWVPHLIAQHLVELTLEFGADPLGSIEFLHSLQSTRARSVRSNTSMWSPTWTSL